MTNIKGTSNPHDSHILGLNLVIPPHLPRLHTLGLQVDEKATPT